MKVVQIADIEVCNNKPFILVAGLNVLENQKVIEQVIKECKKVCEELNIPFIFKASYDKANRSSINSFRGPGVEKGLNILKELKSDYLVPVISDVHSEEEIEKASEVLDVIQIPAFLCRQTDLLSAAAATNLPINIKKGQFLSPKEVENIFSKFRSFSNEKILICERGTSFGYNNLVVDMLGISYLKNYGYPVIFDVTHSVQQPGGLGDKTNGRRPFLLDLAKSAMSIGIAGLFLEVHPNPEKAKCDGPCALPLNSLRDFLEQISSIDKLVKSLPKLKID